MAYEEIGKGIVKRTERRSLGLFIDGTGLDRATRRINRKVDMSALVRGVTSGIIPTVARYYTLIPYEDDSRQRAFLDAVSKAGLTVIVKRLPPKGITRQVSVDNEMSADIVAFALGHSAFGTLSQYNSEMTDNMTHDGAPSYSRPAHGPSGSGPRRIGLFPPGASPGKSAPPTSIAKQAAQIPEPAPVAPPPQEETSKVPLQRIVTVVCPSRDLAYPIALARELGIDTVNADFGQFNAGDVLKSAAKWIDLSDSETIWRDV